MDFLKLLEAGRTPFLEKLFSIVTYLGDQIVFMVAVLFPILALVLLVILGSMFGAF